MLDISAHLYNLDIDCLGVTEANLKQGANIEDVEIKGYKLIWDEGRENPAKKNARVVVYVKEELSFDVMKKYMGNDLMPEVWIRLGHSGTRRTLIGMVYREHTPWNSGDGSQKGQETRLNRWLEARRPIWTGTEETFLLGDINLDWLKKDDTSYRSAKMMKNLCEELLGMSWVQLVKEVTHFSNSAGRISESLIDHVWSNHPAKVLTCGQEELAASDHQLVWVDRVSKQLEERVKKTEKRSMKHFQLDQLEELCNRETWTYKEEGARNEGMLQDRVVILEEKIRNILQKVAPMKVKTMKYRGKPRWLTVELEENIKERVRLRKKAKETKLMSDELEARRHRNKTAKHLKQAKQQHLKTKMEHLDKNSPDSWAAVGEYLGWRKPMSPTMLTQDGKVLTSGPELAEAMIEQYRRKEKEVDQALGLAKGDYMEAGRKLTEGNKAVFRFKKITKTEVEKQIKNVDNKESFGHDKISYGFLKKMCKWISGEMTQIMNLSLEVKKYPGSWKVARVKPLFKGEGCDRNAPKSYRPVALLSAISRIMETILAGQLDQYQEKNKLIHKGVHGFRKSRGTNTAMMEVWEFVTRRTEKGELVALDFLDMSAGFDTLIHLYILRKMEIQFGMDEDSLEWLSSYLKGWTQYTVVEASDSAPRKTSKGAPQGGGLSPILWRSATNDIPEAGMRKDQQRRHVGAEELGEHRQRWAGPRGQGVVSKMVDSIPEEKITTEERLDKEMRNKKMW